MHVGFKALQAQLAAKGAHDPGALAAWIGKKKYGKAGFAALAAAGRKKADAGRSLCDRVVPFEFRDGASGDGLTFTGYAAVFGSPTTIRDHIGEFTETIQPGAFARSLERRTPVLMFDHGKHPMIGQMPLGRITAAREDGHGLFVEARLTDNWLIAPVRDAVRDRAVSGMSFRFTVPPGGDAWNDRQTERTLTAVDVSELGPVVFPAYEPTTANIRSAIDRFDLSGASGARSAERGRPAGTTDTELEHARARRERDLLLRGIRP